MLPFEDLFIQGLQMFFYSDVEAAVAAGVAPAGALQQPNAGYITAKAT